MKKEEIIQRLMSNHHDFVDIVLSLDESEYCLSVNNKWTAGQHLKHIYLSVSPLVKAMRLPIFLLKWIFGKANRPSENYESLVEKYQYKLKLGAVASSMYIPKQIRFEQREILKKKLLLAVQNLCNFINRFSESNLDNCILPHPLLGKITVLEMCYFTIYHVKHHRDLVLRSVGRKEIR